MTGLSFPAALVVAAIGSIASPAISFAPSSLLTTLPSTHRAITYHLHLAYNQDNNRDFRPIENHIFIDTPTDRLEIGNHIHIDNQQSSSNKSNTSNNNNDSDGRPHGYKDPQAQMEMPNNVYIDGELHGDAARYPPRKKKNMEPKEAWEVLQLKQGCIEKAVIKEAYYNLVSKYHPDHNKWMSEEEAAEAREHLYKINAAFSCLKTALQNRPKIRPGFGAAGTSSRGDWWDSHDIDRSFYGY